MDVVSTIFLDTVNGGLNSQWFLVNEAMSKLNFVSRQDKRLNSQVSIRNKVVTYTVDARWSVVAKDWRGVWGSKGDLAAYSS